MIKNKVHDRYGTVLRRGEAAVLCSLDFPEKGEIDRICDKNKVVNGIKITCFLNFIYILVHILKISGSIWCKGSFVVSGGCNGAILSG
jgi:hypothetical protein